MTSIFQKLNPWSGVAGLSRGVWILFFTTLINRTGSMILPFFSLYFTKGLGLSTDHAALLIGVFGATSLISSTLAGKLSDRYSPGLVMKISLLAGGAWMLIYPLATTFTELLVVTPLMAIASEAFRPACMAQVGDLVPEDRRKSAFALIRLAVNLGMSVGPAAGGFLAMVSFPLIFYVNGAASIAAGIFLVIAERRPIEHKKNENPPPFFSMDAAKDPRMIYFLFPFLIVGFAFFQLDGPLPVFLVNDLKLSEGVFGSLFTINTILIVFFEIRLNTATAHWPHRATLAIGAFFTAAGIAAFGFVEGVIGAALATVVWTFGEMMVLPSSAAYIADISPPDRRGDYMGIYGMSFGFCFAIMPGLGLVIFERHGGGVLWSAVFVSGVISTLLFLRLREGHRS